MKNTGEITMKSTNLEYRLIKNKNEYEPLYHYNNIEIEQILARRECEFFVKEGITYKQDSSAIEDEKHIIYVEEYKKEPEDVEDITANGTIKLEIRELSDLMSHPLLASKYFTNHLEVLTYIGTIYIYINGVEWERDSAEIDEDRLVYVLYMTRTGYEWKEDM